MSDLEKFIDLYKSIGIKLESSKRENDDSGDSFLAFGEGDHEKLVGYSCFRTTINFDKNGKFINQGFWE